MVLLWLLPIFDMIIVPHGIGMFFGKGRCILPAMIHLCDLSYILTAANVVYCLLNHCFAFTE